MITAGMPNTVPWPMNLNSAGSENSDWGVPWVSARLRPRTITMKASEAMKWLRPMRTTQPPIMAPIMALAAMAMSPAVQGSSPIRNSLPVTTIAKHTTEPTDRSMPPTISRMVMPTTTMPSMENESSMARMLSQVRK